MSGKEKGWKERSDVVQPAGGVFDEQFICTRGRSKNIVMDGTEKTTTHKKRETPPHTGATMLTVRNGREIFIIKSLPLISDS